MAGALRGVPAVGVPEEVGRSSRRRTSGGQGETSPLQSAVSLGWLWNTHCVREKLLALPHSNGPGIFCSGKFSQPSQGGRREGIAG